MNRNNETYILYRKLYMYPRLGSWDLMYPAECAPYKNKEPKFVRIPVQGRVQASRPIDAHDEDMRMPKAALIQITLTRTS